VNLSRKDFLCLFIKGVNAPRRRGVFGLLPEPRDIRLAVHKKSLPRHELKGFTHFMMAFGQMLSHDILENIVAESKLCKDWHIITFEIDLIPMISWK
jgi:hypothetical protein